MKLRIFTLAGVGVLGACTADLPPLVDPNGKFMNLDHIKSVGYTEFCGTVYMLGPGLTIGDAIEDAKSKGCDEVLPQT